MLLDSFHREHNYLRISLTDKCNFRCTYCLPVKDCRFVPNEKLMTADEIYTLAKIFVSLGVKKIRLTGGEPLIRKDFPVIVEKIRSLPLDEIALTTNGYYLHLYLDALLKNGVTSFNISLDTLDKAKFFTITGNNVFQQVYANIQLLLEKNLHPKINIVLIKGINENEVIRFVRWTRDLPIHVRFIEYMPFDSNGWNFNQVVTLEEILTILQQHHLSPIKLNDLPNSTSKSFKIENYKGTFAIISTVSHPFCDTCNRIRLTADGKLRNCLFAQQETDLLTPLRKGEDIIPLIKKNIQAKHFKRGGLPDFSLNDLHSHLSPRKMIEIGG